MSTATAKKLDAPRVTIRDFQPEDYAPLVALNNATFPEYPETVEEWRYEDDHVDRTKYVRGRLVAADRESGTLVGFADYAHTPWAFDPGRFQSWINVHPDWQRRGIGGTLYHHMLEDLRARDATALKTSVRESMADEVGWVRRRGFVEKSRHWESSLDLRAFDPAQFSTHAKPPKGIRIVNLKDELAEDPTRLRAVYEFGNILGPDTPRTDPYTPPTWEMWQAMVVGSPWSFPEGFFLAKDGDRYIGQSDIGRSEAEPELLYTGFTGVLREYRGRGLAHALKIHALTFAKARGYAEVRTWNSTINAPMLAINEKLGFVKQPAWIQFEKDLTGTVG